MLTSRIPGVSPTRTSLVQVTGPLSEPISIATAKSHLRVDFTDDDNLIAGYITAAREFCEDYTGRAFIAQTFDYTLDDFPRADMPNAYAVPNTWQTGSGFDPPNTDISLYLPKSRVASVTSVKYYDANDALQTIAPSFYQTDFSSTPARLLPLNNQPWPVTSTDMINTVVVRFVASDTVPQRLVQAALLLIGDWYSNREADSGAYQRGSIPAPVKSLLDGLRVKGMGII